MNRLLVLCGFLIVVLLVVGCEREVTIAPEADAVGGVVNPELVARQLVAEAGWPMEDQETSAAEPEKTARAGIPRCLHSFAREPISGDIYHYSFQLQVGPGAHDLIGIHRVVRERRPYRPIRTEESIFLVHGSSGFFENGFLSPVSSSMAVFLAQNDIDVWGIDLAWSLVPAETSDFGFMEDWGLEKDAGDVDIALAVARFTRLMTGNGWRKMDLLGHSLGATVGYAVLNAETQRLAGDRHVKGFVPVDFYFKTDAEETRLFECAEAAESLDDLNNGVYAHNHFTMLTLAQLAKTAPDDPSPVFNWLNNLDAALLLGTSTFLFAPSTPFFHLTAGVFAEGGFPQFPIDLQYTAVGAYLDKLEGFSPYIPTRLEFDRYATTCDEINVPFDDHLGEITVPILYIAGAGGVGDVGLYTTTLLGSTDVTTLIVQLHPPDEAALDYGHNDLFMANGAIGLVYGPLLGWIETH